MRPHALTSRVAVTLMVTLAVCGIAAARPDTRSPLQKTLDSLFYAARYDTMRVLLPALIREAEARGDSADLGRLTFQRGRVEITLGHQAVANDLFDRSIRLCEAAHDTVGLLPALHFKAFVLRDKGHPDDAMKLFEREFDLANRAHILSGQAAGIGNLAYKDLRRGNLDAARAGFVRSIALNRKAGSEYNVVAGFLSMGMLQRAMGNVDSSRYWYKEALRVCRERRYPLNELWSLNNLGALEGDLGNDEAAVDYYSAALKIGRRIGFDRGQALPLMNLGSSWSRLGEYDRAREALDEAIAVSHRAGFQDLEESNINALADLYLDTGENGQAAQACRRILHKPDVFMASERNRAAYGLALALADLDSVHAAVEELEPFVAPKVEAPDRMLQLYVELTYADLLRRDGRFHDALDRAAQVRDDADRGGRSDIGVSARLVESSCQRALGDGRAATASLRVAMDSLEVARVESGKAEGREAYGQHMMGDIVEACRVTLEYPWSTPRAERVRTFYDTLQRYKTRTLLERIRDPDGKNPVTPGIGVSRTITVARLQKNVLRPGDLLLDLVVSRSESFMFAVTRDSCRLVRLPGSRSDLAGKAKLYTDLLSEPDSKVRNAYPGERLTSTQRALGSTILDPVADLIDDAHRVIYAPDGFFAAIPVGTLVTKKGGMLLESKDVTDVPSASVLEWAQAAQGTDKHGKTSMLAVTDESAAGLEGARHETDQLRRRYANVQLVSAREGILDTLSQRAQPDCILHIAAHARVNDASPWHSGFLLTSADAATAPASSSAARSGDMSDKTFLRAWEIANTPMHYDMAVLAGCETAAGRATNGEGVLGLTSAFLSSGVPVVVSSRWAVDDKVTAELMLHFYDSLARGENVATALRDAQLAVRRNPGTRHPFYWAGFSVVGDGTRVISPVKIANRFDYWRAVYRFGFVFLGILGWQIYRRRRSRPAAAS